MRPLARFYSPPQFKSRISPGDFISPLDVPLRPRFTWCEGERMPVLLSRATFTCCMGSQSTISCS